MHTYCKITDASCDHYFLRVDRDYVKFAGHMRRVRDKYASWLSFGYIDYHETAAALFLALFLRKSQERNF